MTPNESKTNVKIEVTLLGTGTPNLKLDQLGPSTLVRVGSSYLLFDCGRCTLLRINQAGVDPVHVSKVFLTHLHSDHVVGLPDLWLTGWEMGRPQTLQLYGPKGTTELSLGLVKAFKADVEGRQMAPQSLRGEFSGIDVTEVEEDVINVGDSVKVTCFLVDHGSFKPALGYRIDYKGCSVVLSGDTRYSENLVKCSMGVDVLIHNAWIVTEGSGSVALELVASPEEAGRVCNVVKPRLAVISQDRKSVV